MEQKIETDILIVGAGVAGAAVAAALKNSPFKITLVDSRPEGKDLNRGDVLYPGTIGLLKQWGVLDQIKKRNPLEFTKIEIMHDTHPLISIDMKKLNNDIPFAYSLDHTEIEEALLTFGKTDNVTLLRGYSAQQFVKNGERQEVTILGKGQKITIAAKLLVGADGRNSLTRIRNGIEHPLKQFEKESVIFWMPLLETFPPGVYLYIKPPYAILLQTLPPGDRLRVAIFVPKGTAANWMQQPISEKLTYLQNFTKTFPKVEPRTIGEHIYTLRSALSTPLYKDTIVLVGDSAHEMHPISSHGIAVAIADAHVLTQILANSFDNLPEKLAHYEKLRLPHITKAIRHTDTLATITDLHSPIATEFENIFLFLLEHVSKLQTILSHEVADYEYQDLGKTA